MKKLTVQFIVHSSTRQLTVIKKLKNRSINRLDQERIWKSLTDFRKAHRKTHMPSVPLKVQTLAYVT